MSTSVEGPLLRHLREISEGTRPVPETQARRHHFVPAFAVSKFATPQKRDGAIFQLDTKTGQPKKTTPDKSCFVEELYTQDDEGAPDRALEAFFSVVENYAAQALERFLADPLKLTEEDHQSLSYYLTFQYQRTPVVLEQSAASQQATMAVMLGVQFADPDAFARKYREQFGDGANEEEIEEFRAKVIEMLKSGDIAFDNPELGVFQMMLLTADRLASTIASLDWVLIEATEDEYVTSDRALAMYDPTPKFPWSGHALRSSPEAETTFPLTPELCLCLVQGNHPTSRAEARAEEVRQVNLRTYGWASQFIYGRSQKVVQKAHADAKAHPADVVSPRTPKPVIMEEADPDDPSVGLEHLEKGWPRGIWVDSEDGSQRYCSYQLVDPSDRESVRAAIAAEEEVQRAFASKRRAPAPSARDSSRSGTD